MQKNSFTETRKGWKDLTLIFLLILVIYIPFLGIPGFDGNEPIRVIVAKEMLKTGNWIIPALHGKPYFLKPPLMNWLIAATGWLSGVINEWTARLPSVFLTLLTGIAVYSLTKNWMSREGRLFSAIATLSTAGLIIKGRTAEPDSLFIFSVTLILLVWMNGYGRQWKPALIWIVSLSLLGIGFLAKGPQIIGYFYLSLFAYLLYKKNLAFFFSRYHAAGICVFFAILGIYLFAVLEQISFDEYISIWTSQITQRGRSSQPLGFVNHLLSYPFKSMVEFLPWVVFVVPAIIFKDLRGKMKGIFRNELFVFSLTILIVNFPLYWLLPGARVRYFLPAVPFFAVIAGLMFEYYLSLSTVHDGIRFFLKGVPRYLAWATLLAVLTIPVLAVFLNLSVSPSAIILIIFLALLSVITIRRINSLAPAALPAIIALFTGLYFLLYTDFDIRHDIGKDAYPRKIGGEINRLLPDDAQRVYELGYDRFLEITCYLTKEVIQLDSFAELRSLKKRGRVFFIFNTRFLNSRKDEEKRIFRDEIKWEKVYSKYNADNKDEIIVGYLR
jgi:4-amino-4-deoxy-L-arabinose transferase-like glycosyltransferase